jgi:DNA-binding XRE family transcriptional regulator
LREERQLPLRKLAVTLDIDSATCWKIEKGERQRVYPIIAELVQADYEELLKFRLAYQVT